MVYGCFCRFNSYIALPCILQEIKDKRKEMDIVCNVCGGHLEVSKEGPKVYFDCDTCGKSDFRFTRSRGIKKRIDAPDPTEQVSLPA